MKLILFLNVIPLFAWEHERYYLPGWAVAGQLLLGPPQ